MIENTWHIAPYQDINKHILECFYCKNGIPICNCKCKPRTEVVEEGKFLIIHNSFDGREGIEWVKDILND